MKYTLVFRDESDSITVRGQMCWGYWTKDCERSPRKVILDVANDYHGTAEDIVELYELLQSNYFFAKNKDHFNWTPTTVEILPNGMNIAELKICLQLLRAAIHTRASDGLVGLYSKLDPTPFNWSNTDMGHSGIYDFSGKKRAAMWRLMCLGESKDYKFIPSTDEVYVAGETVLSDDEYQSAVSDCDIECYGYKSGFSFPTENKVYSVMRSSMLWKPPSSELNREFFTNILTMPPTEATKKYLESFSATSKGTQ